MLIKIDGERFINSDHIVIIDPCKDADMSYVYFTNNPRIEVPNTIVVYIAETLDAAVAFTEETPADLSLDSQIALYLRNSSEGMSYADLANEFLQHASEFPLALNRLVGSNTIRIFDSDNGWLYYHASNPICTAGTEQW